VFEEVGRLGGGDGLRKVSGVACPAIQVSGRPFENDRRELYKTAYRNYMSGEQKVA
jgi:hypothetical protein